MSFVIALCDDDPEQLKYIGGILSKWASDRKISIKTAEYASAEQFLFEYPTHPCDLLLLDIEMRNINGMELARRLRSGHDMLPIIFITGFSEYISEGYDVEALHYLLKPLDGEKLCGVLDRYLSRRTVKAEEVLVKSKDVSTHIPVNQIVYIEAFGRMTQFILSDGSTLSCDRGIGQFEHLEGFLHCHRSYLVNLRYVRSIGKQTVLLDTGGELPLSRRLYREVNREFISYYQEESEG